MKRIIWLLMMTSMTAVGCGAPEQPTESESATHYDEPTTAEVGTRSNLRDVRYCEILVVTGQLNNIEGAVYNTLGLNDCPEEQWKALEPDKLKEEFQARAIILNGPRYFLMDENSLSDPGEVASFDGLEMRHLATIQLPAGSLIGDNLEGRPYSENTIERETEYVFRAGRPVYELVAPDGQVYVMQSYSQIVDPTLTEDDLSTLANRLELPEGWQYRVRELDQDYIVRTVGGLAYVIQDEFENTYQRVDE